MSSNDLTRRGLLVGTLAMTSSCRWLMEHRGNGGGGGGGDAGPAKIGAYNKRTMSMGLRERPYYLHVPQQHGPKSGALPILFLFHGHGGRGEVIARMQSTQNLANRGAFVVAPSAIQGDWTADDVDYIRKIADGLKDEFGAQRKVWAMGFSDGGGLALQIGYKTDWANGIGTVGLTLPSVLEDRLGHLPFTVQVIGVKDPHYTGADRSSMAWEPARDLICSKVGARNRPEGPRSLGSGSKTSAERFDFPGDPPYVWIRVTGAEATHRIYDKSQGDAVDAWGVMVDAFKENGLKMG